MQSGLSPMNSEHDLNSANAIGSIDNASDDELLSASGGAISLNYVENKRTTINETVVQDEMTINDVVLGGPSVIRQVAEAIDSQKKR